VHRLVDGAAIVRPIDRRRRSRPFKTRSRTYDSAGVYESVPAVIQKVTGSLESYRRVLSKRDVRLLFGGLMISATGSWAYRAGLVA
jgi:hypothetical protein